jgi:hypothetical protein
MQEEWIGVDLDGTLAEWHEGDSVYTIGPPVTLMLQRVKFWIDHKIEVKIVTARVAASGKENNEKIVDSAQFAQRQRKMIQDWCVLHIGYSLEVRSDKDFRMVELWDDRAIQIIPNTGQRVDGKL